jgi:hypothetical protein
MGAALGRTRTCNLLIRVAYRTSDLQVCGCGTGMAGGGCGSCGTEAGAAARTGAAEATVAGSTPTVRRPARPERGRVGPAGANDARGLIGTLVTTRAATPRARPPRQWGSTVARSTFGKRSVSQPTNRNPPVRVASVADPDRRPATAVALRPAVVDGRALALARDSPTASGRRGADRPSSLAAGAAPYVAEPAKRPDTPEAVIPPTMCSPAGHRRGGAGSDSVDQDRLEARQRCSS